VHNTIEILIWHSPVGCTFSDVILAYLVWVSYANTKNIRMFLYLVFVSITLGIQEMCTTISYGTPRNRRVWLGINDRNYTLGNFAVKFLAMRNSIERCKA